MSTTLARTTAAEPRHLRRPEEGTATAVGRSIGRRLMSVLATLLLTVAVVALLGVTVAPRVFHYRTATMLTGSMSPHIKPGDVIVDTLEPATAVKVGQIITYHIPVDDHRIESHRVVWVGHDSDGRVLMRTQGDANSAPDPWTARLDSTNVWQVRTVVPMAGTVIRTLRTPWIHILLVIVLPAVLIFALLVMIWAPGERRTEDDGVGEADALDLVTDVTDPITEPITEPAAEPITEPAAEPVDVLVSEAARS